MVIKAGNADRADRARAAQRDREAAARRIVVAAQLAVCERLTGGLHLREHAERRALGQLDRVALAREPQLALRSGAFHEITEHDKAVHRDLDRDRLRLLLCIFDQLESDIQRIPA